MEIKNYRDYIRPLQSLPCLHCINLDFHVNIIICNDWLALKKKKKTAENAAFVWPRSFDRRIIERYSRSLVSIIKLGIKPIHFQLKSKSMQSQPSNCICVPTYLLIIYLHYLITPPNQWNHPIHSRIYFTPILTRSVCKHNACHRVFYTRYIIC